MFCTLLCSYDFICAFNLLMFPVCITLHLSTLKSISQSSDHLHRSCLTCITRSQHTQWNGLINKVSTRRSSQLFHFEPPVCLCSRASGDAARETENGRDIGLLEFVRAELPWTYAYCCVSTAFSKPSGRLHIVRKHTMQLVHSTVDKHQWLPRAEHEDGLCRACMDRRAIRVIWKYI